MKKFVSALRNHEDLPMSDFKAGKLYSGGIVEGRNLRINLYVRKAYGHRSFNLLQIYISVRHLEICQNPSSTTSLSEAAIISTDVFFGEWSGYP